MNISISTSINAPIEAVWSAWTQPEHITQWNFASKDWCCPSANADLRVGGKFCYRMEARDNSMGFDFTGTFTQIEQNNLIEFELEDNRKVTIEFIQSGDAIQVTETFTAEDQHSGEQQRQGWQAILDNFKLHVESLNT